ncbi:type II toxin-antitoxin system RelE/ParE family toxin [Veillonella sp. CHU110]|uniref:type II toxin-antitoxin system RelE/ParE family toxin n=1 Tax=Veillonella sp. CHU110 TaxID=2490947 RepID=UPI000F8C3D52|nr:type II toxin-antitoxin system RelE/ParE family toxin [Veillonella sp. CHU110]
MATYDIQLSAFAEYNLLNIYCYIAESFSIETAKYTSQKIYKAIKSLSYLPHRYRILSVSKYTKNVYHIYSFEKYDIYYSINEIHHTVTILAVLNQRQAPNYSLFLQELPAVYGKYI